MVTLTVWIRLPRCQVQQSSSTASSSPVTPCNAILLLSEYILALLVVQQCLATLHCYSAKGELTVHTL